MIKIEALPSKAKAFSVHGSIISRKLNTSKGVQYQGSCPFCGREDKFFIREEEQLWDCKYCGKKGNLGSFLLDISERNERNARARKALPALAKERSLSPRTLQQFGVGFWGGVYTIPIYNKPGNQHRGLIDLRRYRKIKGSDKKRLLVTPSATHGLFGLDGWKKKIRQVWLAEGEWDAMALSEMFDEAGEDAIILSGTGGASVFKEGWLRWFQNKELVICYDNDPAGRKGERLAADLLRDAASSIRFVHWPRGKPEGWDARDHWSSLREQGAERALESLQSLIRDVPRLQAPPGGSKGKQGASEASRGASVAPPPTLEGPGYPWPSVIQGYRQWLEMPNPEPLLVILGAAMANRLDGDSLWLFIVAPPGGSKTELLMSLDGSPLIYSTTSLTPHALISGAQNTGGKDPSLLPQLNGRVLVVKDFTSILSMNEGQREEILGTLRDAYDGKAEKVFGTGLKRTYHSRFGVIAGVTPAIEKFTGHSASLGERFLKYYIKIPGIINVGDKQIRKALSNITKEVSMREQLQTIAQKALDLKIGKGDVPRLGGRDVSRLVALSKLVASLRGSVSHERFTLNIEYIPKAEIGTRLAKQLAKLGMGISLVKHERKISDATFLILVRVARDTIPDRVERIMRALYIQGEVLKKGKHGRKGSLLSEVSEWASLPSGTVGTILQDLSMLRTVKRNVIKDKGKTLQLWQISKAIKALIDKTKFFQDFVAWANHEDQEGEE